MCDAQGEGTDHSESTGMGSDVDMTDETAMEHKQLDVDTTRDLDWEMDKESSGSEQGSDMESTPDSELMHLILKKSSPLGVTSAGAPSDLASESASKPTVTSAIRTGLTNGVKTGLFQFFSQGTQEQNNEYHARETEHSEEILQDDQHHVNVARVQQAETKKGHARIRKQKERAIKKRAEMQLGLRSPGGTKRRVSVRSR
jgi:hypothetical protein